jgi:hypothetical protein
VQVEIAAETVYKTETVFVDATASPTLVKVAAEKDKKGAIITSIAISVLAILFIAYLVRYFMLKNEQERLDAERDIQKLKESKLQEMAHQPYKERNSLAKMIEDEF